MQKSDKNKVDKVQYRINLDEDVAIKFEIVCAIKRKNPSELITSLILNQLDDVDTTLNTTINKVDKKEF